MNNAGDRRPPVAMFHVKHRFVLARRRSHPRQHRIDGPHMSTSADVPPFLPARRILPVAATYGAVAGAVAGLALTLMNGVQHLIWHGAQSPVRSAATILLGGVIIVPLRHKDPPPRHPRLPHRRIRGSRRRALAAHAPPVRPRCRGRRFRRRRRPGGWAHRRRHRTVGDPRAPHHLDAEATRRRDARRRRHRLSVAGARATLTGHPQATHERPRRTSRPSADEFSASCRGLRASAGANAEPSR